MLTENSWLRTLAFRDEQGRQFHPDHPKAMRQQAALFARLANGEQVKPESIMRAVARGEAQAEKHQRRVSAGRSLRSGRPSGNSFGHTRDDSFADSIKEYMRGMYSGENE